MSETYSDCSDKLDTPKVTLRHVFYRATNGVCIHEINMAVGMNLLDHVDVFELLRAFYFVLLGGFHRDFRFLFGHELRIDEGRCKIN